MSHLDGYSPSNAPCDHSQTAELESGRVSCVLCGDTLKPAPVKVPHVSTSVRRNGHLDNYATLDALLSSGRTERTRQSVSLGNNTRAERRPDGRIAIRLHSTDVLTFAPDGSITLQSGGYRSVTTKARIHAFTPADVRLCQEKGRWFLRLNAWADEDTHTYRDGMTIARDGSGHWDVMPARITVRPRGMNWDVRCSEHGYLDTVPFSDRDARSVADAHGGEHATGGYVVEMLRTEAVSGAFA